MYNSYFGLRETPFSVTPDPDLFYPTTGYQELFSTVRYGVESRKGLTVVTGEVGTGKTTLVRRLMRSMEATTQFVVVFHTHLSFIEMLRMIASELGIQPQGRGSSAIMHELGSYLTEQFRNDRRICVVIDEAQNLSDAAFEGIRSLLNLDIDGQKLLQIILIGQPELETKLDQFKLRHVKQRIALRCLVPALEEKEVASYIQFRLRGSGYSGEGLFSPAAVQRIAVYSNGAPRLINIICDNSLLVAQTELKKGITMELVERVATDLRLKEDTEIVTPTAPLAGAFSDSEPNTEKASPTPQAEEKNGALHEPWSMTFEHERQPLYDDWPVPRRRKSGLLWTGSATFLALIVFAGAALALYSPQTRAYLTDLRVDLEDMIVNGKTAPVQIAPVTEATKGDFPVQEPSPHSFGPEERTLFPDDNKEPSFPPKALEVPVLPRVSPSAPEPAAEKPVSKPSVRSEKTVNSTLRNEDFTGRAILRERLKLDVHKAINNRAIAGVEVSVVGDVTFLDGRVDTPRQKFAAEEAARSVPAVKYVRNRIEVNFPFATRQEEGEPNS